MAHAVVLVVEDETLLRLNAIQIIKDAGYEVIEAADADAAIAILESRSDIGIVFTDIQMPGSMDGLKLANAIRGRWPPVRLILTSGKTVPKPDEFPSDGRFIGKPYTSAQLLSVVGELAA
ncbi:MAG TPA: response regulator [Rhizomicrobium sp.]